MSLHETFTAKTTTTTTHYTYCTNMAPENVECVVNAVTALHEAPSEAAGTWPERAARMISYDIYIYIYIHIYIYIYIYVCYICFLHAPTL